MWMITRLAKVATFARRRRYPVTRLRIEVRRLLLLRAARGRAMLGRRIILDSRIGCKVDPGGHITINDYCEIRTGVLLDVWGKLTIDARTFVGQGTVIGVQERVEIGADCLIGEYVTIRDQDHRIANTDQAIREQGYEVAPIRIGNDVWLGAKVTVCKGVNIGTGCVVGANAVVTRDLPPYSVAIGVPARVIRQRTEAEKRSESHAYPAHH